MSICGFKQFSIVFFNFTERRVWFVKMTLFSEFIIYIIVNFVHPVGQIVTINRSVFIKLS